MRRAIFTPFLAISIAGGSTALTHPDSVTEARVAALEKRLEKIEQKFAYEQPTNPATEKDVTALFAAARTAFDEGDMRAAELHLTRVISEFGDTEAAKKALKWRNEIGLCHDRTKSCFVRCHQYRK